MPEANTYQDIWIRWIHSTWENEDAWRTDIRPSVLNDSTITKALFILDDGSCVFVPLPELRRVLSQKEPNNNGSIIFNVSPRSKKVEQTRVSMEVKLSKRNQAVASEKFGEEMRNFLKE
jgi:hypothetical protein